MSLQQIYFLLIIVVCMPIAKAQKPFVSKTCGNCDKIVSPSSKLGDTCPYCLSVWGIWGEKKTTPLKSSKKTSSPKKVKKEKKKSWTRNLEGGTEIRSDNYKSGEKKWKGYYRGNKKVGVWFHWYENGRKKSVTAYKDGAKHGVWTYWDVNGRLVKKIIYEYGKEISRTSL